LLSTRFSILSAYAAIALFTSCSKDPALPLSNDYILKIPKGFPEIEIPENNPLTSAKIRLGKSLFFEKALSLDSSISCASCHFQERAFSDPASVSTGVQSQIGKRNASALFNLAYKKNYFRDGGVTNLDLTGLNAIHAENEFNSSLQIIFNRLNKSTVYRQLFLEAYNDTVTINGTLLALGSFLRTLISGNSAYDDYINGNPAALNESEIRGMQLFFSSKTSCSECHGGFNLRNEGFFNNGFFEVYSDSGRQRITLRADDRAKFSVPSLRNISVSGPYMHNGTVNELSSVIERYNQGGFDQPGKSELIRPLGLTENEKLDLLHFLNTLTDYTFLNDIMHKPE
jgi:cytochrome c peroxidase